MACTNCQNSSTSNCGCKDAPYTTVKTYSCPPDQQCPVPVPCSEYMDARCTTYNGSGIVELGLAQGASLQRIIQQLTILTLGTTPSAGDPCSACQATWNLFLVSATSTTLTIAWEPSLTANTYQVEFQQSPLNSCTPGTWSLLPAQTTLTATIGNRAPNTAYIIRVRSICDTSSVYSVTIKVLTLT